jgi:hypothetical protein
MDIWGSVANTVTEHKIQATLPSSKIYEFEILFSNRDVCGLAFLFICKYIS